jgi:hypothetical protein
MNNQRALQWVRPAMPACAALRACTALHARVRCHCTFFC